MNKYSKSVLICFLSTYLVTAFNYANAQEWTRFRGPNGTGIANPDAEIPTKWSDENVKWKVSVPGKAHSSPVLWGDKLFLSTVKRNEQTQTLICFDAKDGKIIWEKPFEASDYSIHRFNSHASTSAALTKDKVFFTWGTPENIRLVALDHSGNIEWQKDLGPFESQHGPANSPMIHGNKVIFANDQLGVSYLVAFDTETGNQIWRVERGSGTKAAYSTPCLFKPAKGQPYLVFNSSTHGITGVAPDTGAVLWEKNDGLFDKRSVSSPVFSKDMIFGSCGSGGGGNYVVAISAPDNTSKIMTPKLIYKFRRSAPYVPTPLVVDEKIYFISDQGIVSLMDLKTGKNIYSERTGMRYFGSPVLASGHIFAISTSGVVTIIRASDKYEMVSKYDLGEESHSTPAVANGKMYLRTSGHLYCIGK